MMRFEERRQKDDESIDRFLADLESLRRRSDLEDSNNRRNFSIASKFFDGMKNDDLRTMLATNNTLSKDNAPTPEEIRQKHARGRPTTKVHWYKPRHDMDQRRSYPNCGSANHHVVDCTTYKQGMKSLGYRPDGDDMSQMEEHEFYSGLISKIGARCFFLQSRAPLQNGLFHCFESSKKSESHNTQIGTRCRKKTPGTDRLRRAEKAVAEARDAGGRDKEFTRDKLRDSRC